MNLTTLKKQNLILLEALAGSKAYGTDLPTSDTDIKGVFIFPKEKFYGLEYTPQVSDEKNDIVFSSGRDGRETFISENVYIYIYKFCNV